MWSISVATVSNCTFVGASKATYFGTWTSRLLTQTCNLLYPKVYLIHTNVCAVDQCTSSTNKKKLRFEESDWNAPGMLFLFVCLSLVYLFYKSIWLKSSKMLKVFKYLDHTSFFHQYPTDKHIHNLHWYNHWRITHWISDYLKTYHQNWIRYYSARKKVNNFYIIMTSLKENACITLYLLLFSIKRKTKKENKINLKDFF